MRHWTSKVDYTAAVYTGTVPGSLVLTETGIEIPIKRRETPEFPTGKAAGSMVRVSTLVKELEQTAENYQRESLPVSNVEGMVRRAAHYNLAALVDSTPADLKKWPDPPHVEFANCAFDSPDDVKRFVETYGFALHMIYDPHLPFDPPEALAISVERLRKDQEVLRRDWGQTKHGRVLKDRFLWSPDDIDVVNGKPRIITRDIWDYTTILFLIDLSAGRLKVCHYPDCRQLKYFVMERRNQKFCSSTCKNAFNIKFWLANPANRDRWNASRREKLKSKQDRTKKND